jgi:ABC-type Fe3+-hydroxamate transport system substrate-binding protein
MLLSSPSQLKYIPTRIVSLVPSQTELLHDLGLEKETIAITKFCVHPNAWFKNKTHVGGTKSLHIDKIRSLQPDLIIANKEENIKEQVEELAADFPVWVTDVNTLESALEMIKDIGLLTHKSTEANLLSRKIMEEFNKPNIYTDPIPTAYLIWQNPFMTVGGDSFISDMMQHAGFDNVFKNHSRYPEINIEDIIKSSCKLIILSSEPFPFSQKHINLLQDMLPGIKIILANGEIFSWYGSRLLKAPAYFKKLHEMLVG